MKVKDIVADYLKQHGHDGLCTENCGCGLNDLMPCGDGWGRIADCVPAVRKIADEHDIETCDCDSGDVIYVPANPTVEGRTGNGGMK